MTKKVFVANVLFMLIGVIGFLFALIGGGLLDINLLIVGLMMAIVSMSGLLVLMIFDTFEMNMEIKDEKES